MPKGHSISNGRLRFLGTGTSAGVPVIGCGCAVCTSDDPRDQRLRTSACLRYLDDLGQERVILIDAGPDLRQQSLAAGFERLDAILLTHNHVDHVWGLDEVRRFNVLMDGPIDVYTDKRTLESVKRVYQHIFEPHRNVQKSFIADLIGHEVSVGERIEVPGVVVTPIRLLHGRLPILGFRFDRADGVRDGLFPLAYCTDVSSIPPETWGELEGLSVLVLDALRHRKHPTHFTVDQAVRAAERIGAEQTYLVHMTHDLGHAETDSDLPSGVMLAFDGLQVLS